MPDVSRGLLGMARPRINLMTPLVISCGMFMAQLDSTIIATSIPQMAESFGQSPLQLNVAITSYLISLAVFIPISGWIADRFGPRRVFCAAMAVFTVGSMLCGVSTSLRMLVAMRVLQGLGGAMMTPVGRLILVRSFPKDQLLTVMSYISIPALIGPTVGPLIGGFLTTYISWRWIFYINLPIGVIGISLALRYVENFTVPSSPKFDFLGFIIVGTGLGILAVAIEYLGRHVISGAADGGLFAAATALLGVYIIHARRLADPVLDLKLLQIRSFRASVGVGSLCRIAIGAVPFLLPLLLQLGFGMDPLQSGLITFVSSLGAMVNKTMVRFLLRRLGFRRLLAGNAVLLGCTVGGMALFRADTAHWLIWSYLIIYGFVRSVQFTSINALTYSALSAPIMSKGTSFASVVQQLFNSFGVALGATLLALTVTHGAAISAADFPPVFLIVGALPVISALGFLRLSPHDGAEVTGYRAAAAPANPAAN
jgi:EmrB/QacA subfamily drug resistance transporter